MKPEQTFIFEFRAWICMHKDCKTGIQDHILPYTHDLGILDSIYMYNVHHDTYPETCSAENMLYT
jgi:hypothetical protein